MQQSHHGWPSASGGGGPCVDGARERLGVRRLKCLVCHRDLVFTPNLFFVRQNVLFLTPKKW